MSERHAYIHKYIHRLSMNRARASIFAAIYIHTCTHTYKHAYKRLVNGSSKGGCQTPPIFYTYTHTYIRLVNGSSKGVARGACPRNLSCQRLTARRNPLYLPLELHNLWECLQYVFVYVCLVSSSHATYMYVCTYV